METLTLKVNGMTCGGCVRSVKKVLESVPGVRSAEVSLERAQATVLLDAAAGSPAILAALRAAVEAAGYEAAPST
jgi:copper chaperone